MSLYCMARIRRLNLLELQLAEAHGRRADAKSQKRRVCKDPPVTWLPAGIDSDPLALEDRYSAHVEGAFIAKGKGKALHLLVKFPESVDVAATADAEAALQLAVEFAQEIFGGDAVFAARMDRDEKSLTNADVFVAPRYFKKTKHTEKLAISLTRHLKLMAEKHGPLPQNQDILRAQGQALQDEFARFLRVRGYQALRGQKKETLDPDWVSPEAYGVATDRRISAADREVATDEYQLAVNERQATARDRAEIDAKLAANEREHERQRDALAEEAQHIRADASDAARVILERAQVSAEQILAEERGRLRDLAEAAASDTNRLLAEAIVESGRTVEAANRKVAEMIAMAATAAEKIRGDADLDADGIRRAALADGERDAQAVRDTAERDALAAKASAADHAARISEEANKKAAEIVAIATEVAAKISDRAERRDLECAKAETEIAARRDRMRVAEAQAKKAAADKAAVHADLRRRAGELEQAQLQLARRALDDQDLSIVADDSERGVTMNQRAMSDPERAAYQAPWGKAARAFAQFVADVVARAKAVFAYLATQRASIASLVAAAKAFETAAAKIPVNDRHPEVASTQRAAGLLGLAATAAGLSPGTAKSTGPDQSESPIVGSNKEGPHR